MSRSQQMPTAADAIKGRSEPLPLMPDHYVNKHSMLPPWPPGMTVLTLGMGCFWGAERLFWTQPGVYVTAVGYAGGTTDNPTYEEVCTGSTGHAEVVRVVFDPNEVSLETLLTLFWENHDPTQGMRQGNDIGTQYRSILFYQNDEQEEVIRRSAEQFESALHTVSKGPLTTEILPEATFYYAETYHQQYLAKNPQGYCGLKGTGVRCIV